MKSRQSGLTLVELMVTLAVAIILLAVGMPLFTGVVGSNRATTQANTFLAAFKLARSEAVKRATEVSVCSVADPAASPVNCGNQNDWANGILVFTDGGTSGTVDGADVRIRVFANDDAAANATTTGGFVRFQAQGEVSDMTANGACGASGTCIQLDHTDSTASQTRCMHVMPSGQVRLERAACS